MLVKCNDYRVLKPCSNCPFVDDTEIDFDLDDTNVDYDEYFPTFYYQKCGFSNYIQVTLTGSNV